MPAAGALRGAGQNSSYGAPFCQSLKAAPVDAQVTCVILQALEPAALEASLAVAADLQAERAALEQQWRQRLERAQYQVDQARRRYASAEPENRLVARTLERDWEAVLAEQVRLTADYERFRHERPQSPSPAELAAIRQLANDLPALWQAQTTTSEERQTIVRLLLERVLLSVVDGGEQVGWVPLAWWQLNGHTLVRPVARWKRSVLRRFDRCCRTSGRQRLRHDRRDPQSGSWRPQRRETFNAPMSRAPAGHLASITYAQSSPTAGHQHEHDSRMMDHPRTGRGTWGAAGHAHATGCRTAAYSAALSKPVAAPRSW